MIDEREAFEAGYTFKPFVERTKTGTYRHPSTQCAWEGWQARAEWERSIAKAAPADALDAARYRFISKHWTRLVAISGYPSILLDDAVIDAALAAAKGEQKCTN